MQIEAVEVIRNFGTINQNLAVEPGNVVRTLSETNNIMAKAVFDFEFPKEFRIYDVSEFVACFESEDFEVSYHDNFMKISDDMGDSTYYYSGDNLVSSPPNKDLNMPEPDIKFVLTSKILSRLRKRAAIHGHKKIYFKQGDEAGSVVLSIDDMTNDTANSCTVKVEGEFINPDIPLLSINIDNLKLLAGDYNVEVSSKLISKFEHTEKDLTYWIALNKKG
jgi:hypothetical protein